MSEKPKPDLVEPLPPEPPIEMMPDAAATNGPAETERGAVDFGALSERVGELASRGINAATIAYHGIATAVARMRRDRAGSRMERMDHKQALYTDLEAKALGTFTEPTETTKRSEWVFPDGDASPETAVAQGTKARTLAEKIFHKRLEKKQFESDVEEARRNRVHKIYAYNDDPGERNYTMGTKSRILTRARKAKIRAGYYRDSEMTPEDRRAALSEADANPVAFQNSEQKRVSRNVRGAERSVRRTAKQPIMSRWRNFRRNRAIGTIKKQHQKHEKHKERLEELR